MNLDERGQASTPAVEHEGRPTQTGDRALDFSTPFFDSKTAAAYVCNKSVRAFYDWCRRHGVTRRSNGSVAKVDLDRVLRRKRTRRLMHPASLLNLRKRRKAS